MRSATVLVGLRAVAVSLATAMVALVLAGGLGRPVLASCLALEPASIVRGEATSVFAGTVTRVQQGHVWMRVEAWFLGANPVDEAEIIGGSEPGMITSADWMPSPGEDYLVVADRAAPHGFVTKLCQQTPLNVALLQRTEATFGPAQQPPFGAQSPSPAPSDAPGTTGNIGDTARGLLPILLAVATIGALVLLLASRVIGHATKRSRD
jgi:hypothetical protein